MEFICFRMICAISLQAAAWAPSPNNLPIVPRNIKFTHLREYTASTCELAAFGFVTRSKTCAINAPIFRSSQVPPNIWTNTTYACNSDYQMFEIFYSYNLDILKIIIQIFFAQLHINLYVRIVKNTSVSLTCVTPTRTSLFMLELPFMISPVPFKKPTPPLKNPDIRIFNTSSSDACLTPLLCATRTEYMY